MPIIKIEDAYDLVAYKVIVGAVWETYLKINYLLEQRQLEEFENFVWWPLIDRRLVLINANCHGWGLHEFLKNSKEFEKRYIVYPIPQIQVNKNKKIDCSLLKRADVYIH